MYSPLNQAYALYTTITGLPAPNVFSEDQKLGQSTSEGRIFEPWGEYSGGPPYGWISDLDFSTAVQVYESVSGKPREQLRDWVLEMFSLSDSTAANYAENWVLGYFYGVDYSPGSGCVSSTPTQRTVIEYNS